MSKNLLYKFIFITFLGFVAIYSIPQIDRLLFPESPKPTMVTLLGVGMAIIALTGALIYTAVKNEASFPKLFLGLLFLYNALIVLVKFTFGTTALYEYPWISTLRINQDLSFWVPAVIVTFLLYVLVFFSFYKVIKRRVKKVLEKLNSQPNRPTLADKIIKPFLVIGLVCALLVLAYIVLMIALPLFSPLSPQGAGAYLGRVLFSNVLGLPFIVSILIMIYAAFGAFESVGDQAIMVRNASLLATFFWIGFTFLLIYHALWVVYILILTSIWPLKVVLPSPSFK